MCGRLINQLRLLLLTFVAASSAANGQQTQKAAAPSIDILKLRWQKEVRLPRNFDPSVIPATGGFADPAKAASSASNASSATQSAFESNPYVSFPSAPGRLAFVYVYSMKVRNAGTKTIDAIAWDYFFIDSNGHELGKHRFLTYQKVRSEESRYFREQLRSPPVRVVSASESPKRMQLKFIQRAVIQCVRYEDGSFWENPPAQDGVCALLNKGKPLPTRRRDNK